LSSGVVECFGYYPGDGAGGPILPPSAPVRVTGVTGAISIAGTEALHTMCAASGDGTVRCWGENTYGQVGNGTRTTAPTPVRVVGF
jgi:hypothetical protein